MDGRAYNKLSDGKLIGVSNRTDRKFFGSTGHWFYECDEREGSESANAGVPGDDVYA